MTSARYGKFAYNCSGQCCVPHPGLDCWESVEENRPEDWLALKFYCDNQTSCVYENRGSVIDECQTGYTSDYIHVFFDCLPESTDSPVAFTAYSDLGFGTRYVTGQQVIYDKVHTNSGGHYNQYTSTFICPYDGIYVFSLSILADFDERLDLSINRNDDVIAFAWAYTSPQYERYEAASAHVTSECTRGDVIWVKSETNGGMFADQRVNTFTGFLLQKL